MNEVSEYYKDTYSSIQRAGLQGWGNSLNDRLVEWKTGNLDGKTVLEIGASSGEHFAKRKVRQNRGTYFALDLTPGVTNPELRTSLELQGIVRFVEGDAEKLPFEDDFFDVSLSLCVLAHVSDPHKVLAELRRVTKPGGTVVLGMPADPGMLNRLVKAVITYPLMRKIGIENPQLLYALEHRNGIGHLITFAKNIFRSDVVRWTYFPFGFASWNSNLLVLMRASIRK